MFIENKNKKIAHTFNEYFETIVIEDLPLYYWKHNSELLSSTKYFDRIKTIIKNHPSTKGIKKQFQNFGNFSFRVESLEEAKKVIQDLKNNKSTGGEIPVHILK